MVTAKWKMGPSILCKLARVLALLRRVLRKVEQIREQALRSGDIIRSIPQAKTSNAVDSMPARLYAATSNNGQNTQF